MSNDEILRALEARRDAMSRTAEHFKAEGGPSDIRRWYAEGHVTAYEIVIALLHGATVEDLV